MGDLSKNLSRSEFKCKCGRDHESWPLSSELVDVLQETCDHFANELMVDRMVIIITRGFSCKEWNAYIWGRINGIREANGQLPLTVPWNGKHPEGIAADFVIRGVPASRVQRYLLAKYPEKYGIGSYPDRTHLDVRPEKARWDG